MGWNEKDVLQILWGLGMHDVEAVFKYSDAAIVVIKGVEYGLTGIGAEELHQVAANKIYQKLTA